MPLLTSVLAIGIVGVAVAAAALRLIVLAASFLDLSLAETSIIQLAWLASCLTLSVWAGVGIWRAASRAETRTKWLVRAGMTLTVLALSPIAFGSAQAAREYALIAAGHDPIGPPAEIHIEGDRLHLVGALSQGTAKRFRAVLDRSPRATIIILTSGGGRIGEAFEIAELIRDRGLNTVALQECNSACTLTLLAGRERSIAPNALVGFHQSTMDGNTRLDDELFTEDMRAHFKERGVAEAFIDQAFSTGSDELWTPSEQEMLAANFLSRKAPLSDSE